MEDILRCEGLAIPAAGEEERYAPRLTELADGLPTCFCVNNDSLFVGELITTVDEQPLSPLGRLDEVRS